MTEGRESVAPRARSQGLIVRALEGEVLIFDVEQDKAHCLNQTAGFVWQHCDGQTSVEVIRQGLERELGTPVSTQLVWQALSDLAGDGLLDGAAAPVPPVSTMSRRDLMKRAGVTLAIPVIASIAVPTGVFAASARTCGSPCTANNQCMGCGMNGVGSGNPNSNGNGVGICSTSACKGANTCCVITGGRVSACSSKANAGQRACDCCSGMCDKTGMKCA